MKSTSAPVSCRLNGVTTQIGTATYPVYDAVSEAIDDVGEAKALELINAQTATNEKNRVRALQRPGSMSKTILRSKALERITGPEFVAVAGNGPALEALIEAKMEEVKAEALAAAPQLAAVGATANGDEDDDE